MESPSDVDSDDDMSLSDFGYVYDYIPEAEDLHNYGPGGFHPVRLNDTFQDARYRVVAKLGHGIRSTVWLATDAHRKEYVALTVCVADASAVAPRAEVLRHLSRAQVHFCQTLLDEFVIEGPNGLHQCLVSPPAMTSLRDAKSASVCGGLFQPSTARAIVAQLVLAVAFLHGNGVVHGVWIPHPPHRILLTVLSTDLSMENVLLRLPPGFHELSQDQLYEVFGEPDREAVHRLDGQPLGPEVPEEIVFPTWLGRTSEQITLPEVDVLLSDFDEAFLPLISRRTYSNAAIPSQPPEAQFLTADEPLSYPSDIWSLGCLIWSIVGERPLFESWVGSRDELLDEQVNLLGKLPQDWWERWESRGQYWVEDGDDVKVSPSQPPSTMRHDWRTRLELCVQIGRRQWGLEPMEYDEMVDFLDLMRAMLTLRPADRPTAEQVWGSRYIQIWCLPPPQPPPSSEGAMTE